MALQRPGQGKKTPSKFQYRGRSAEDMQRRASQSGGSRDSYVHSDVKFFTPAVGDNRVRILPPTWDAPEHFGYEIHLHYGIGADNAAYLCRNKMLKGEDACPVCIERTTAEASGEKEYADSIKPGKRVSVWIINRDKPNDGPLLWNMPWTVDRDICAQAVDKDTGEVFQVDNPDDGYDVLFKREGQGQTTKYVGLQIARRPSPLSDDDQHSQTWLDYIVAHPVPSMMVFYEPDHIKKIFAGVAAAKADAAEKEPPFDTKTDAKSKGEDAPARRSIKKQEPEPTANELPTWDEIHNMDEDSLVALIDAEDLTDKLPEDASECPLSELASAVCEALKIEQAPQPAATKEGGSSLKDRLAKLRQK